MKYLYLHLNNVYFEIIKDYFTDFPMLFQVVSLPASDALLERQSDTTV